MSLLWVGGEDIDFPNGNPITWDTTAGHFRSGYARGSLSPSANGTLYRSTIFSGGEITSCWLSAQCYATTANTSSRTIGLGKSGTTKGLFVGLSTATSTKWALHNYDGSSLTQLATETGSTFTNGLHKIDLQLVGYGASADVYVYIDGALLITLEDTDIRITDVNGFDSIFVARSSNLVCSFSEIIVSTEDSRTFSLVTHYPNGVGSLLEWTGAYSTIDEAQAADADLAYVNSDAQDAQYAMSDCPAGTFSVHGIKIVARATMTGDASVDTLKLGVLSGGTVDVDAGQALTTGWASYERMTATINGSQLTTALLDAMELNLRSAA